MKYDEPEATRTCREWREIASACYDGEPLGRVAEDDLREHLAGCAACRRFERSLPSVSELFREEVPRAPRLVLNGQLRSRPRTVRRPLLARMAALVLGFVSVSLFLREPASSGDMPEITSLLSQLERALESDRELNLLPERLLLAHYHLPSFRR